MNKHKMSYWRENTKLEKIGYKNSEFKNTKRRIPRLRFEIKDIPTNGQLYLSVTERTNINTAMVFRCRKKTIHIRTR